MSEILEGFYITMATILDFFEISFSEYTLWAIKDLHNLKFRKNSSGNCGEVS